MRKIMESVDTFKNAAGYIGAGHLYYASKFIKDSFFKKQYEVMFEYYPTLLEAAVNYRIYSRQLLAKHDSKDLYNNNW